MYESARGQTFQDSAATAMASSFSSESQVTRTKDGYCRLLWFEHLLYDPCITLIKSTGGWAVCVYVGACVGGGSN